MINETTYLSKSVVNIDKIASTDIEYSPEHEEELSRIAKLGYPNEICGFLIGEFGETDKVTQIIEVTNYAADQERKFNIDPLDYIKAEQVALEQGRSVIGIFHSHPNYPAIPSKYDLEYAHEGYSYPIISVRGDGMILIKSWKLSGGKFINQKIKIA